MVRVSDVQLAEWFEQVADGLDAGMTSVNALALARELPQGASDSLSESFGKGNSWAVSLGEIELSLLPAETAIITSSEQSATLPQALRRLSSNRKEIAETKKRMLSSLAYPAFLTHFVPFVFSLSYIVNGRVDAFFVSVGIVLIPVWSLAILGLFLIRYWPSAAKGILRYVPLFSGYSRSSDYAVLCNVLASCLRSGMSIDRAWEAAILAADNPRIYKLGEFVLEAIKGGNPASEGIAVKKTLVPRNFYQLYRTGESTGSLEQNLEAAGVAYSLEAKGKLKQASVSYPTLITVGVLGYGGYKVVMFYKDYFDRITEMSM